MGLPPWKEKERWVKLPLRHLSRDKERWVKLPLKRQWRDVERWVRLPLRHLRLEKDQKRMKMSLMKMLLEKEKERERGVPNPPLRPLWIEKERWVKLPLRPQKIEKDQKRMKMSMMKMLLGKEKEGERGVPKPQLRPALTIN